MPRAGFGGVEPLQVRPGWPQLLSVWTPDWTPLPLADLWWREEYEPVVQVLHAAGIGGPGSETERYLRLAMRRYLLLHTHAWTDDVIERLLGEVRRPAPDEDDTKVHQIVEEMQQPAAPGPTPPR